jgi:hypothetical protein
MTTRLPRRYAAAVPLAVLATIAFASVLAPPAAAQRKAADPAAGNDPIARIRAIRAKGGTDQWDADVKPILLELYDSNRSGTIDTPEEVRALACPVLAELDRLIKPYDKGRSALTWTYGFQPDTAGKKYAWVGNQLGFAQSMRAAAFAHMKETCRLRVR